MRKSDYLPDGRIIKYVANDNEFILAAKTYAKQYSLDKVMPTGAVLVKNGTIIGMGANGSDYHEKNGCERVRQNIPSGEGYELCNGCNPNNHAEPKAIENAKQIGNDPIDSDLYLWGHFWCCEPCWNSMIKNGIKDVFLMQDSKILFDKDEPRNIVGKQFTI